MTRPRAQFALSTAAAKGLAIVIGAIVLLAVAASLPYFWHAAVAAQLSESRDILSLIE